MGNSELSGKVRGYLNKGLSREEIYSKLLSNGHKVSEIEKGFSAPAAHDNNKKTVQIVVTIGAVLVAAGIFSFISANWDGMDNLSRMAVVLLFMVASYSLGWYFKENKNLEKTGEALILLGSIIFGASIFLAAQMFNVRANWPDGFVLWMFGVLGMAFATKNYNQFWFAALLGAVALIAHPFELFDSFDGGSYLLTSSGLLTVATVIAFMTGLMMYKKISK